MPCRLDMLQKVSSMLAALFYKQAEHACGQQRVQSPNMESIAQTPSLYSKLNISRVNMQPMTRTI